MIPLCVLIGSFALFLLLGLAGIGYFHHWQFALRAALGLMFLLTASAHWGRRRPDLIAMVPPAFPAAGLLVTFTGIAEIAGAVALQIPKLSLAAAAALFLLLISMFPANIYAARHRLKIGGRAVPPVFSRTMIQIAFLIALWFAVCPRF